MTRFPGMFLALLLVLVAPAVGLADSLEQDMAKARTLHEAGQFDPAAKAFNDILVKHQNLLRGDPAKAAMVWEAFATSLKAAGRTKSAEEAFKRAAKHREKIGQGAPAGMAEPSAAVMDKYRLASLKNDKAQEHYRRGAAYLEEKQPIYAILEFEKALALEADNVELMDIAGRTMAEYGDAYSDQGKSYFDQAKALLEKVRKAIGDGAMTKAQWTMLGRACTYARKYDFKAAEDALSRAVKLDPKDFLATLYTGDLCLVQGNYQKAIEWYEKASKIDSEDLRPLWGAGDAWTGLKEYHKALDAYARAFEMHRENAEAAFKYATGLKNVNRLDESIHFHEVAIALDPTKARYHLGLVAIYLPRIMDFSAKKHLSAALALEPENPWCHFYQGLYLEMRRRIDEAIAEYELAAQYGPEMLDVKYQLANIYNATGNSFPGNNFSNEDPSHQLEYLPFKDLKRAYRLYKEIVTVNPKYVHAAKINEALETLEEKFGIERQLTDKINKSVR
ncbi:MAG: TPR repeat protein [Candidatus Ozemobacter sibiricus]|uniref:TPR repeat protein n=1 Tax=Candidatus Ozemobacter sibiricus TaxID=2268124 RepID=A0A367ZS72_9BACT|nr:MAG: TPR repeat protein [Candidatus Ozemobacter sibiricus]